MKTINKPKKGIKKTSNKDKNGFTLVELLAVIVVLAMLVLIAGRAVTGQITKAKKNTFRTESIEFAKGMIDFFDLNSVSGENNMTIIPGYEYNCQSLDQLKNAEYIEISDNKAYDGYIEVWKYKDGDEVVKLVGVTLTDGKSYSYATKSLSEIEADKKLEKITDGVITISGCPASPTTP